MILLCCGQVDFEPQYAMEYFGFNPDIDDTPQLSLQETIVQAKPFLMVDGMTDGQWQVMSGYALVFC